MTKETALHEVKALCAALAMPVSQIEAVDGWTPKTKDAVKNYFNAVALALQNGQPLPPLDVVRGLDAWGVSSGELFEQAVRVARQVKQLSIA